MRLSLAGVWPYIGVRAACEPRLHDHTHTPPIKIKQTYHTPHTVQSPLHSTALSTPLHSSPLQSTMGSKQTAAKRAAAASDSAAGAAGKRVRVHSPPPSPVSPLSDSSFASTDSDEPVLIESVAPSAAEIAVVNPTQCLTSLLPIFREHHTVTREPSATPKKTEQQLHELTFAQWLDYHLSHPSCATQRSYLFSDEQYCLLLSYVTSGRRVVDYAADRQLSVADSRIGWLYKQTATRPTACRDWWWASTATRSAAATRRLFINCTPCGARTE